MLKQTNKASIESLSIKEKMSNLETAIDCLEWVAKDYQLDPNHEDYLGFINIDTVWFNNPVYREFFGTLHLTYRYFQVVFEHFGLVLESATENEIIICAKKK